MGHAYRAVGWNRQKKIYDTVVATGIVLYLTAFVGTGVWLFPDSTIETLLIRALGSGAFVLLHVILLIGPLHRFFPGLSPLLYNRRHLGVAMFVLAMGHAALTTVQFHLLGDLNPLVSILSEGGGPWTRRAVPFQLFGFLALVLLFLMAATSHDFWLSRLSPPIWKGLHMGVYAAYVLLVAHVAFGIGQQDGSRVWLPATLLGALTVGSLHLAAAFRERPRDRPRDKGRSDFVEVCSVEDIPEGRARTFVLAGDRVAVFRYGDRISAVSSTCRHQGGPLGEGRVIGGCIVCPWHGYEYDPATGASPPPFTEKVPTFRVRLDGRRILVETTPYPAGTYLEPARIPEDYLA